ncbi:hypothetical protein ACFE04_028974 [Oxalis oulophora]
MELLFIVLISISISILLKFAINLPFPRKTPLPPGPRTFPIIGNFLWLSKSFSDIELILRSLVSKLGPIITLHIGNGTTIFISDRTIAHEALIQNGAIFADRPPALPINRITTSNQHNISSAPYGPTWRALRRNLTAEILHPLRVKNYSHARKWVLDILVNSFKSKSGAGESVKVFGDFQYAMFCLLVLMCFGDKLEEKQIKEIEKIEQKILLSSRRFRLLNFFPIFITSILMRKRWQEFYQLMRDRENILLPLIRARREINKGSNKREPDVLAYVDTLLELKLPSENNRNLTEQEIISVCSEFLNAGTDTTATALEWIIANLVKHPEIQKKLLSEIKSVVIDSEFVNEEALQKMPFLKSVVLEGLRRHPPAHFVVPHSVTNDFILNGHLIPKLGTTINFMVADIGQDPKVWEDPMKFKPERFLDDVLGFDITGSREIKMMPFGVGRRICPGYGLAMLHLEYFVGNLIWEFKWDVVDGDEVSLEEKQVLTTVMKYPLQAVISSRSC